MSIGFCSENKHVLSLFSGAGGFSLGFLNAGLKPLCGFEINEDACISYENNIGSTCRNIDLENISPSYLKNTTGGKKPFIVIGGPPCQGFSTAGLRNHADKRNQLIFNYLNIIDELRPCWFIFENVEGLLTSDNGNAVFCLVKEFLKIGYTIRLEKINFAAFGVPQTRKRIIIIGNRIQVNFSFPEEQFSYSSGKAKKINGKPFAPTVMDAISGLGNATKKREERANYLSETANSDYDALMRNLNLNNSLSEHFDNSAESDVAKYKLLDVGQSMKDLPEKFWHESFKKRAFRRVKDGMPTEKRGGAPSGIKRLHGNLQSLTITGAAFREFIHPLLNRPLTIRECARIQSFPDRFEFHGNAGSVMQQIGNAVPPLASEMLARHIIKIDGAYGSGKQTSGVATTGKLLGYVLTDATGMSDALKKTDYLLSELQQSQLDLI